MLGDHDLTPNIAVKDLKIARKFHQGILGLKQVGSKVEVL
jgi:hypothetical protein